MTPSMMYLNVTEMNYIAPDSSVPYDRFRVEIFLVHGVVVGPGRDTTLKYGTEYTNCDFLVLSA